MTNLKKTARKRLKGYITFAQKKGNSLYIRIGLRNWVLCILPEGYVAVNPLNYVGFFTTVECDEEVTVRGRKFYLVHGVISIDADSFRNRTKNLTWDEEVLQILKAAGKRSAVRKLSKLIEKALVTPDVLCDLYFDQLIPYEILFYCFVASGFINPASSVRLIEATIHYAAEEVYKNIRKNRYQNSLPVFLRFVRFFLHSLGVNVQDSLLESVLRSTNKVDLVSAGKTELVYPRSVSLQRRYCLERLASAVSGTGVFPDLDHALQQGGPYVAVVGGAGTGKTTYILDYFASKGSFVQYTATTGKAAQRYPGGVTLHKWLGYNGCSYTSEDTYCDFLVIDESSMLNWELLYHTLSKPHRRIIFVGDPGQLPPIFGENVFSCILNYVPKVLLTKVHRGKMDVRCMEFSDPAEALNTLRLLLSTVVKESKGSFQVISPFYFGQLGIDRMNRIVRSFLFSLGLHKERIIVTRNIYDQYGVLIVSNGATGYIVSEQDGWVTVSLDSAPGVYTIPKDAVAPGFCISVHKAQGTEWDYVFFVCPESSASDRELFYTATTRGRQTTYVFILNSI